MNQPTQVPTVVYIMGAGRCGSTVMSIVLGSHPDIEAVGEIKSWSRHKGLPRDLDADEEGTRFWENVLLTYTELGNCFPKFEELQNICSYLEKPTKLLCHLLRISNHQQLVEYENHVGQLIASIHAVADKSVVLDSSKNLCRALILLNSGSINVVVIHLIRDPRGTVWSFMKKGLEQESKKFWKSLFDYVALNGASYFIRKIYKNRVMKVKYEELTKYPEVTIRKISERIGVSPEPIVKKVIDHSSFKACHLIDGNRVRKKSEIVLKVDDEWENKLPRRYSMLTKVFALPFYYL